MNTVSVPIRGLFNLTRSMDPHDIVKFKYVSVPIRGLFNLTQDASYEDIYCFD